MKTLATLFLILLPALTNLCLAQKQKVWLDADTGNEMDDLYAIVRLVKEPSVDLVGLSSAHFNNADLLTFEKWNAYDAKTLKPVVESQRINEEILQILQRTDIAHPIGADRQIGWAWGQQQYRDSPGARGIIDAAGKLKPGEQLHVLTLGPLTNIASAIMIAPDILPKIKVYCLAARYDPKTKVWNKSEFNVRNDLNAFDYVLDREGLDLTVMTLDAARPLAFQRENTYQRLDENNKIEQLLENRWREQNPQDETRIMWDLALVEAYLKPELAQIKTVKTPPENTKRKVYAYVHLDEKVLAEDFWTVLKKR